MPYSRKIARLCALAGLGASLLLAPAALAEEPSSAVQGLGKGVAQAAVGASSAAEAAPDSHGQTVREVAQDDEAVADVPANTDMENHGQAVRQAAQDAQADRGAKGQDRDEDKDQDEQGEEQGGGVSDVAGDKSQTAPVPANPAVTNHGQAVRQAAQDQQADQQPGDAKGAPATTPANGAGGAGKPADPGKPANPGKPNNPGSSGNPGNPGNPGQKKGK